MGAGQDASKLEGSTAEGSGARNPPRGYSFGLPARSRFSARTRSTGGTLHPQVFLRRAAGESIPSICRWLEREGVQTSRGNSGWISSTVSDILRSRVYLGEAFHGDLHQVDAHPPLIDEVTWQRAQAPTRVT